MNKESSVSVKPVKSAKIKTKKIMIFKEKGANNAESK